MMHVIPDEIIPADINEDPHKSEKPRPYVERIALKKNQELTPHQDGKTYILTGDTTVAVGTRILGKAENREEAKAMLTLLSGRNQQVITSIVLQTPDGRFLQKTSTARIKMKRLSNQEIESYLDLNDWQGKAGAYGIQGYAQAFIQKISGSHSAIVGLPLYETRNLLLGSGYLSA